VAYPDSPECEEQVAGVLELFNFLGIFLAKSMQDQRLVDLPLSGAFLKVMSGGGGGEGSVRLDVLGLEDLAQVEPGRGALLVQLRRLAEERRRAGDEGGQIVLDMNGTDVALEDLGFVFFFKFNISC